MFCLFDSLSTRDSGLLEPTTAPAVLARLSQEGAFFSSAYTPCPESNPARASVFTGLDPSVHGVWTNGVELPEHEQTFPGVLARAGYSNWLVGRWQLAGVSQWTTEHVRPGDFARKEWAHGALHRSRQNAYLTWLQQTAPDALSRLFTTQADPDDTIATPDQLATVADLPDELSFNHWIGARIADMIESQPREKPFLAVAGFSIEASMGAQPPQDQVGEDLHEPALRQADAAIGHMLAQLDATDRADDTVIIVAAARGNTSSGTSDDPMSERSLKTPLLLRCSAQLASVDKTPVSTLDIAPTIIDAAGIPGIPRLQGRSLLGELAVGETARDWALSRLRQTLASGVRDWQTALRADHRKLVVQHASVHEQRADRYRLFDLATDPYEQDNLADKAAHASTLEAMIDLMIDSRCTLEDRTEPRIAEF